MSWGLSIETKILLQQGKRYNRDEIRQMIPKNQQAEQSNLYCPPPGLHQSPNLLIIGCNKSVDGEVVCGLVRSDLI